MNNLLWRNVEAVHNPRHELLREVGDTPHFRYHVQIARASVATSSRPAVGALAAVRIDSVNTDTAVATSAHEAVVNIDLAYAAGEATGTCAQEIVSCDGAGASVAAWPVFAAVRRVQQTLRDRAPCGYGRKPRKTPRQHAGATHKAAASRSALLAAGECS